jgi:hypothetical protein
VYLHARIDKGSIQIDAAFSANKEHARSKCS